MAKKALIFLMSMGFTQASLGQTNICRDNPALEGACVECGVGYENVELVKSAPPLYWDLCKNDQNTQKLVYFLPTSVIAHVKNGRKKQSLRKRPSGQLLLVASMGYAPWGAQEDLQKSKHLQSIKAKYGEVMFKPLVPTQSSLEIIGEWKNWIETYDLSLPGLDYYAPQALTMTFKADAASQVANALKRNLGLLGQVKYTYKVTSKSGEQSELVHSVPIFLGGLIPPAQ